MADPPNATQADLSGIWVSVDEKYFLEKGAPLAAYLDQGARGYVLDLSEAKDPSEAIDAYTSIVAMVPPDTGLGLRLPGELRLEPAILEQAGLVAASFAVVEPPWDTPAFDLGKSLLVGFVARKFGNVQQIADYYAQIEASGVYWTQGEVLDLESRVDDFGPNPLQILVAPRTTGREGSPFFFVNDMKDKAVSTGLPIKGVVLDARWPGLLEEMPRLASIFPAPGFDPAQQAPEENIAPEPQEKTGGPEQPPGEDRETASVAVSDSPTTEDTLGYSVYADALADFTAHPETLPPLAIGITAAWGSGKTSLMRQVQKRFDDLRIERRRSGKLAGDEGGEPPPFRSRLIRAAGSPFAWIRDRLRKKTQPGGNQQPPGATPDIRVSFRTVWVDVWRYENSAALWASLAEEVYQQTARQMTWWERQKFRMALDTDWEGHWPEDGSVLRLPKIVQRRAKKAAGLGLVSFALPLAAALGSGVLGEVADQASALAAWVGIGGVSLAAAGAATLTGLGALRNTLTSEIKRFAGPPDNTEQVAYSKKSEDQIHRLVKILSRVEENVRLAIFVDDLDRCSPNRVVDVVESINLLFSQSDMEGAGAVFFVGLDVDMVAASIDVAFEETVTELRNRQNPAGRDFGHRFLQKILQMTFMIPPPLPHRVQAFLDSLLGAEAGAGETAPPNIEASNIGPTAADRLEAEDAVQRVRLEGTIGGAQAVAQQAEVSLSAGASDVVREEAAQVTLSLLRMDSADVQRAVRGAVEFLEPRPRNYKRFLNAFRLQVIIASRAEHRPDASVASLAQLAKWTALQLRWPAVLEEARTHEGLFEELEPLVTAYRHAVTSVNDREREVAEGSARPQDLSAAREALKLAYEAFPPRIRATGEFEALIEVLAAHPPLAGADLHGLVLV